MSEKLGSDVRTVGWIGGLPARGPHPELADKLSLFGQFVGDWEITECRNLQADGSWTVERGELHWRWILDGRAVQDVWSTTDQTTGRAVPIGTTVRFYDAKLDAWHSVWISPLQGVVRPFVGRAIGAEIVLEGTSARGNALRWIFSDIAESRFRWRSEEHMGSVRGWVMNEEMHIERRSNELASPDR